MAPPPPYNINNDNENDTSACSNEQNLRMNNILLDKRKEETLKQINESSESIELNDIDDYDDNDNVPLIDASSSSSSFSATDNANNNSALNYKTEKWYVIALQVFIPYIIAGYGMVGAGIVLDIVQHWTIFIELKEIYVLVPALLGLKGNLEMTLASRLSTQANIGQLNTKQDILKACLGNFALTQIQAIVVGFLASIGATLLKLVSERELDLINSLVLVTGSMCTASLASLLLGTIMMFVIIVSKRFNINPDNVATPLAASMGDLVTLSLLSWICSFLYNLRGSYWILIVIILVFILLAPFLAYISYKNSFVKEALFSSWTPVIMAMCISSVGGVVLSYAVKYYKGIAVFQPVINGVGGNLVAIFASRISTSLHCIQSINKHYDWSPQTVCSIPYETFFGKNNAEAQTARVLLLLALPGHILFLFTISKIEAGHVIINVSFVAIYLVAAFLQILLLLVICYGFVHFIWKLKQNPDNVCIPYLTALGDFLGTTFLAISFHMLYLLGEKKFRV